MAVGTGHEISEVYVASDQSQKEQSDEGKSRAAQWTHPRQPAPVCRLRIGACERKGENDTDEDEEAAENQ